MYSMMKSTNESNLCSSMRAQIKMGSGLHVGWCIEGAIGSKYKIDCTYLSPHAEMADRLEAGSKIYGTPIQCSHWFVRLLSPKIREFLRPMDRISVEGCPRAMTIYTFTITDTRENCECSTTL